MLLYKLVCDTCEKDSPPGPNDYQPPQGWFFVQLQIPRLIASDGQPPATTWESKELLSCSTECLQKQKERWTPFIAEEWRKIYARKTLFEFQQAEHDPKRSGYSLTNMRAKHEGRYHE